jgi:aspartate carbamoyltransferase regulatory subunit
MHVYTQKPKTALRCSGCGCIVGPDSPIKTGFYVRDGEVQGFFHSKYCFENKLKQK